jgi:hypothetical protein
VYPHIGDLTNLTGYPPLKPNIIFCDYLLDHNLSLRMDHQFKEDRKTVPTLRFQVYLQRKSISGTYIISITSLPEDEQTSKHGGGGRYNFRAQRGANKKTLIRKKKMRKKRKENMSIKKKEKIYEYV